MPQVSSHLLFFRIFIFLWIFSLLARPLLRLWNFIFYHINLPTMSHLYPENTWINMSKFLGFVLFILSVSMSAIAESRRAFCFSSSDFDKLERRSSFISISFLIQTLCCEYLTEKPWECQVCRHRCLSLLQADLLAVAF